MYAPVNYYQPGASVVPIAAENAEARAPLALPDEGAEFQELAAITRTIHFPRWRPGTRSILHGVQEEDRRAAANRRADDLFLEDPSVPEGGRVVRPSAVMWEVIEWPFTRTVRTQVHVKLAGQDHPIPLQLGGGGGA